MNTINHDSISEAIKELNKVGNINLAKKLERILKYNEIKKPELHNKKDDKTTSHYKVNLTYDELETIKDLFLDLEVASLTIDGEAGAYTEKYVTLLDNWSTISDDSDL